MEIYYYHVTQRINYRNYLSSFQGYTIARNEEEALYKIKEEYGDNGVIDVYVERKPVIEVKPN